MQAPVIEYAPRTRRWHDSPRVRQTLRSIVLALFLMGIAGGARYGYRQYQAARQERRWWLNNALYEAALRGDEQQVRCLLAEGIDPEGCSSALCGFVIGKHPDSEIIPKLLIEAGADVNRDSPLLGSLETHREKVALVLIDAGANVNAKSPQGRHGPGDVTPLHKAYFSPRVVRALIAHGADVEARTGYGETPLFWALQQSGGRTIDRKRFAGEDGPWGKNAREALQCVRDLIQAGADVNAKDKRGVMPLHLVELRPSELAELGPSVTGTEWMLFSIDHEEERHEAARLLKMAGAQDE